MNSASEQADLRQVLQNQGLALFIGQGLGVKTWIVQFVLLTSIGRFKNYSSGTRGRCNLLATVLAKFA
jgi:hypothetical protein